MSTGVFSSALTACGPGDPDPVAGVNVDDPDQQITVTEVPPPAISGGTLIVASDGHTAVAADADRDRVWIVDLQSGEPAEVPLERGDEPGRLVEDASGRVHVALRRAGAVVTLDVEARSVIARREVCRAPRGVAYDASLDAIHVACAGGELVTLPASGGPAVRKLRPAPDLRDVVVEGDRLLVSRFRSAETLVVGPDGAVLSRRTLPVFYSNGFANSEYAPSVAWRMAPLAGGGALMVHQRSMSSKVTLSPGGYYQSADCDGNIVHAAVSRIDPADVPDTSIPSLPAAAIPNVSLPVDIAVTPDGARMAIVAAGRRTVVSATVDNLERDAETASCSPEVTANVLSGQPVAVAFDGRGEIVVQLREPAALEVVGGRTIALPGESVKDTGHDMFHRPPNAVSAVACASCHPEGHEDGRTWDFDPVGLRRTQALGGGILKTAPLHWSGDLQDLAGLMGEVFVSRMGGQQPGARRLDLMARYLDSLPAFPASPPEDDAAVARGEVLFHDKKVACADCHGGLMLTNNRNEDVGKGERLQVPSLLGIAGRAPFMHDGCAATLRDRFDPLCGGDKHGDVSGLTSAQLDDLVAYLETL
ncbi:cytochrome-c peroxidase [Sorangium atrum]|uniref:Cytochrome-c peroxidase n=1 Tax=Sorangium atrum TaxID=2995308 RepID=A0ABT5C0M3_9BACT|nr:cytochrome-c peroxidase [Sorangium aterium]MDC0679965.1 cytochrome-c peroxidase [Sorangium aterium]